MFLCIHVGKRKAGRIRDNKPHYYKLTKSSKNRFYNLYHSGKYDTSQIGLVFTCYK
jgi:hypothetical protein